MLKAPRVCICSPNEKETANKFGDRLCENIITRRKVTRKKKENRSALSYFEQVKNFEKLKNCIQNSHCYSF